MLLTIVHQYYCPQAERHAGMVIKLLLRRLLAALTFSILYALLVALHGLAIMMQPQLLLGHKP